jgi:hypothetical protein
MINAGILTPKSRAKASSDGSYLPLVQFPEFADAIDRQLARRAATGRNEDMQSLYRQVEHDEKSRLRWRWIRNKFRGIVNSIGLIVWIITILVFAAVLIFAGNILFHLAGSGYENLIQEGATDQTDALRNLDGDTPDYGPTGEAE